MTVDGSLQLSDISYNAFSQVTQLKTGAATSNPRVENYSYDGQTGRLTGQTVKNTSATSTYLDLAYSYSRGNSYGSNTGSQKTGQLTKIVDNLDRNRDKLYEFDALGRLRNAKGGVAAGATGVTANWTQAYSYDRYGNKTGVSPSGVDQNSASIAADGLTSVTASTSTNRITTSGWEYDLAGNLIRGQNASGTWQKFEYDAAGRLVKIKNDSNTVLETYTYGASRERLMTETSSGRTYYAWGGQSVVCEYTETSTTPSYSKSYVYAGSRLLMTATKASSTTETQEFHHPDRLGTQLVTNGGSGSSYRQTTFPFGTTISAETTGNSNQVFTSYDRSAASGLDYAMNRTYSQGQSRFTQVDPIGMSAASFGNPQSNNLYSYVQNMPTDFVDPSGLNMNPFIGHFSVTVQISWFERMWDNYWGADNGFTGGDTGRRGPPDIDPGGVGGTTSPRGDSLPECAKRAILEFYAVVGNSSAERFRGIMGALDAVRTHIGFPSWTPPAQGERLTGKQQADAFTYFYNIYFHSASHYDLSTARGMALLVHEFTHVMQYRETSHFVEKYLLASANWGTSRKSNNPYERRGYVNQDNARSLYEKRPDLLCPKS